MVGALTNGNLLKAQMLLRGVNRKDLAGALNKSTATVNRKINGKVAFTAPEIQACVELLSLDTDTANSIFFAEKMS